MKLGVGDICELDPARVKPLPGQPRKRFSGIRELADSMRKIGQTTPGIITAIEPGAGPDGRFQAQLVDGERRLRACREAGIKFRAEVRASASEAEIFAVSLAANFSRQEHDPIEISDAVARLTESGHTQGDIAVMLGKSPTWVGFYFALQKLHPEIRKMLEPAGENEKAAMSLQHGIELSRLPETAQLRIGRKCSGKTIHELRRAIDRERNAGRISTKGPMLRSVKKLRTLLCNFSILFEGYSRMPAKAFDAMVEEATDAVKTEAVKTMQNMIADLTALCETVEESVNA